MIAEAVASGQVGERVWVYLTYRCNLNCGYCLTSSGPGVPARGIGRAQLLELAQQAAALGFRSLGITGGEPFLEPWLPQALAEVSAVLPVVVLSNGTLFDERCLAALAPLAGRPLSIQLSLDHADPVSNDVLRAPNNQATVIEALQRLRALGLRVRIASTTEGLSDADRRALVALVQGQLGVAPDDHIERPIVARGRAANAGMGCPIADQDLLPELTITADGAFYSAFGPTVRGGKLDTDLLLCRDTLPLRPAAEKLLGFVQGRAPGQDARQGIR